MEPILAYTAFRLALGINIFMHGFVRLRQGRVAFSQALQQEFSGVLPPYLVARFGTALPLFELLIGACIIVGVCTVPAMVAGALLISVLMFGKSLKSEWNVVAAQLPYAIAYYMLLRDYIFNSLSIDTLLHY